MHGGLSTIARPLSTQPEEEVRRAQTIRGALRGLAQVGTALACLATSAAAAEHVRLPDDSADVAAVVARFHAALAAGDSAAVLALLADDVVVLESGGSESRDEYRAHHLPADIEFARSVPSQRGAVHVRVRGDVAWATANTTTQGEFRGRQINSTGVELMVLSRERGVWKIRAIHWSSRNRRPAG
jgi:uncharacterized protein (TIGR02246 family)